MFALQIVFLGSIASCLGVGMLALAWQRQGKRPSKPVNEHPVRRRLVDLILRRPGVRLATLWKELEANRKTTKYHLLILEEANIVTSFKAQQTLRFFPSGTPIDNQRAVSVLLRGRVLEMAQEIAKSPGIVQKELGKALRLSRRVMRVYVDLMVAQGLLDEVIDRKARRYYPTRRLRDLLPSVPRE